MKLTMNKIIPDDLSSFTRLGQSEIELYTSPPVSVTMLTKTFIHDSLYNPNYGYFSKQVQILSPSTPVNFKELKNNNAFLNIISDIYSTIDKQQADSIPQVWHTPTELFKPFYGYSIADYILHHHADSNEPLVIYEIGAGTGTLMNNILDRIAASNPFLYKKIEYTVIEISSKLAFLQQESLRLKEVSVNHANIKVVNKSILDWSETEERNCFILAMEVIDNLAHDMIRYDFESKVPYQAIVSVDASGNYQESYELVTSPVIKEYLEFQSNFRPINPLLNENAMLNRRLKSFLWPFQANLSEAIYLPTNTLKLFQVLKNKFPRHCLCLSDFSFLPESIEGTNAPVVQRRYKGHMIPCSTYLVQPGWFDIFFPTNFEELKKLYDHVMQNQKHSDVVTHREFLEKNSKCFDSIRTKSGDNPMLTFFENVNFFTSHNK